MMLAGVSIENNDSFSHGLPRFVAEVERHDVLTATVRQHRRIDQEHLELTPEAPSERQKAAIEPEKRTWVGLSRLDVAMLRIDERKPGSRGGKTSCTCCVPLHRMPRAIPTRTIERRMNARPVAQTEFISLKDEGRARKREEQRRCKSQIVLSEPARKPTEVVIRQDPRDLAETYGWLNHTRDCLRMPGRKHELEREDEVEVIDEPL
jgi:hypothetical protein